MPEIKAIYKLYHHTRSWHRRNAKKHLIYMEVQRCIQTGERLVQMQYMQVTYFCIPF